MTPPSLHESENPPAPESLLEVARASFPPQSRPPTARERADEIRDIWSLTWPLVVGQVMANIVPLIDIFMLGSLGTPTLAAVGYASQFLMLAQASLMAIGSACVALMARAIGAGDTARARGAFSACLWVALGVTIPFTLVTLLVPAPLMEALGVDAAIIALAVPYFRLTLASALPMSVALTYEHACRAGRDTFGPMLIAGFVSLLKIGLNYVFIFGSLKLGLAGAGGATLIAQCVAMGLFLWLSARHPHPALHLSADDLRNARPEVAPALRLALPAVGERFVMNLAMLCYFRFLAGYGVSAIAAYNVGVRILAFTWIPGLGLSVAAATLVGHSLGAGDAVSARRSGWQATRFGLVISLVLAALFIALRVPMARVFTQDPAVVDALDPFILLLGIALPFLVSHFTLAGALRGAGDTVTPLKAAAIGNWAFRVPLGYLFAEVWKLSLPWVWAIMLIDHLARAIWLVWSFHVGPWYRAVGVRPQR